MAATVPHLVMALECLREPVLLSYQKLSVVMVITSHVVYQCVFVRESVCVFSMDMFGHLLMMGWLIHNI